jgi:dUTP pyrophosphatase
MSFVLTHLDFDLVVAKCKLLKQEYDAYMATCWKQEELKSKEAWYDELCLNYCGVWLQAKNLHSEDPTSQAAKSLLSCVIQQKDDRNLVLFLKQVEPWLHELSLEGRMTDTVCQEIHQRLTSKSRSEPLPTSILFCKVFDSKREAQTCVPTQATPHAAGYDLASAEEALVPAHQRKLIDTNISIALPPGTYGRIAPRSGLAWKHSIDVSAGVIDADYRGSLKVLLVNHSDTDFKIQPKDRIAQLILEKIETNNTLILTKQELPPTQRSDHGFGSTGTGVMDTPNKAQDNDTRPKIQEKWQDAWKTWEQNLSPGDPLDGKWVGFHMPGYGTTLPAQPAVVCDSAAEVRQFMETPKPFYLIGQVTCPNLDLIL